MTAKEYEALEEAVCKGIEKGTEYYANKYLLKNLKEIKSTIAFVGMDNLENEEYIRGLNYARNLICAYIENAEKRLNG